MDRTRQYFTFVYGILDQARAQYRYVMAGHPAPVLVPKAGPPVSLPGRGLPIGMIEHATYEDETATLEPGDPLYFYTDGVIEALDADEREFGYARLVAEIERLRTVPLRSGLDRLADTVREWPGGKLRDDVSLLAIERIR